MRTFIAIAACLAACLVGCSGSSHAAGAYGAQSARFGESLGLLGWNMSVSNLRWDDDYVLVDVDASPTDPKAPHTKPEDIRFGLYGALAHPMESNGLGSCDEAMTKVRDITTPLSAPPGRLTGTVCLGPLKDRSQVRGVYSYSPRDRIAETSAAYPAAFPVGLLPTNENDTGLVVKTTSLSAWRADGIPVTKAQLGDPGGIRRQWLHAAWAGDQRRRGPIPRRIREARRPDDATGLADAARDQGISPACAVYGSAVLVLPDASLNTVRVNSSLCTQGEINQALLYATVAIVGTHAGVWTIAVSEPGPTEWGTTAGGVGPWVGRLPDDPRYDPVLLRDGDTRNVVDALPVLDAGRRSSPT